MPDWAARDSKARPVMLPVAGERADAEAGAGGAGRRLSAEDLSVLALETETVAGHTCKIMMLGGPLDLGRLRSSIGERLHRAPELRMCLREVAGVPWWVPDAQMDLTAHVLEPDAAGAVDEAGFRAAVAGIFARHLDRSRPLWRIDVIPQLADGGSALIWRIHHALADGMTAMRMASAVLWDPEPDIEPGAASPGQRPPVSAGPVAHHRLGGLLAAAREAPQPWRRSPFDGHIDARQW